MNRAIIQFIKKTPRQYLYAVSEKDNETGFFAGLIECHCCPTKTCTAVKSGYIFTTSDEAIQWAKETMADIQKAGSNWEQIFGDEGDLDNADACRN